MEKTLAIIKPNAVKRNLIGKIISRIEDKGLKINGMKMLVPTIEQAKKHYAVHEGKDFYDKLIEAITSSPIIAMVVSGEDSVSLMRLLAGATNPQESQPGTIRGDFSNNLRFNVVHTSDSVKNANKEISIYFDSLEIYDF